MALYFLIFTKREELRDEFVFVTILFVFLMASNMFFPEIVGDGLNFFLNENLDSFSKGISLTIGIFLFGFLLFKDFFDKGFWSYCWEVLQNIWGGVIEKAPTFKVPKIKFNLRSKVSSSFRKTTATEVSNGDSLGFQRSSEVPTPVKELQTKDLNQERKMHEVPEFLNDSVQASESRAISSNSSNSSREKTSQNFKSFSQLELIQCISIDDKQKVINSPDKKYFNEIIDNIEGKLAEFKIDAKIIHILKGPVVDTFELELGEGVRVAKVKSLTQDLSLALSGAPIRIIYPMEGKTTVGIEVPRDPRDVIYLDECLESKEFNDPRNKLALAMGKDSFGQPFVADLAKMPHLLVAGATGAGKSVYINTILVSLLIKMSPEKLKLILVDPKQLELALYANIPHLILPVITDPERASLSLMWAVQEMEKRYSILAKVGARSIDSYNLKIKDASPETISKIQHHFDGDSFELPFLVIIIDEFADLILTKNGKSIEANINKLAAKARACGIHLIIATQRPSVDVITGLIKNNFPSRVSFRVTASQDSRTILNVMGAENLLGKGDMLYKIGVEMRRLHSAYVDEEEIAILMDKICQDEPVFSENAIEFVENEGNIMAVADESVSGSNAASTGTASDPLYKEAVSIVIENRSASASMLQRRLKVGYNRAANLVETMERNGVVGPQQGSKPRQVLVNSI